MIDLYDFKVKFHQVGKSEDINDWLYSFVCNKLLNNGKVVLKFSCYGSTKNNILEFCNKIVELSHVEPRVVGTFVRTNSRTFLYTDKDNESFLQLNQSFKEQTQTVEVSYVGHSQEITNALNDYCKENTTTKEHNNIYVVASSPGGGLTLNSLGKMEGDLTRENYTNEVLEGYDYIFEEFSKPDPYGRLAIINGPAGTGKTRLIRGFVSKIKNCLIVLLPSKLVSEIDSPQLISMLAEEKSEYGILSERGEKPASSTPILFIIEDADHALVPRENDNVLTISSLLNLTDGLLGSMLDLRVIATTNAERINFDEALTRPGRLCRHIHVDALDPQKASEVYKRLTSKEKQYKTPKTLAEIYADASGKFKEIKEDKKVLGFGS